MVKLKLKKQVAVLFGGRSEEHEVSCQSAQTVIEALDKDKYEVIPVGITKEGKWLAGLTPQSLLQIEKTNPAARPVFFSGDPAYRGLIWFEEKNSPSSARLIYGRIPVEVVIPVLHGPYGEDGTVQGLLELTGVPYVGCGVLASAVGMDKIMMKNIFARHNLPQPRFLFCRRGDWERSKEEIISSVEKQLKYPCFVKPANLGSSIGISKAGEKKELIEAVARAARYDRRIIFEEYISGREIEISVLGNEEPVASLPGEITYDHEFYDYQAKYRSSKVRLHIPASLPDKTIDQLREMAIKAYRALDCAGLGRVDFFLREQTGELLVNEINTMPGFTRFSMYPKLWEASGLGINELLDRLIELALERHRKKICSGVHQTKK